MRHAKDNVNLTIMFYYPPSFSVWVMVNSWISSLCLYIRNNWESYSSIWNLGIPSLHQRTHDNLNQSFTTQIWLILFWKRISWIFSNKIQQLPVISLVSLHNLLNWLSSSLPPSKKFIWPWLNTAMFYLCMALFKVLLSGNLSNQNWNLLAIQFGR